MLKKLKENTLNAIKAQAKKPGSRLAFRVPASGVISNYLLEDLERIWSLRDAIPNPPDMTLRMERRSV